MATLPLINPLWWLGAALVLILVLRLLGVRRRHTIAQSFSALAREVRMNYSAVDRFHLASRLQQSPRWTGGIVVHDIIYGAAGGERRFVATVERRASENDNPVRLIVACVESLDAGDLREAAATPVTGHRTAMLEMYREAIAALGPPAARLPMVAAT